MEDKSIARRIDKRKRDTLVRSSSVRHDTLLWFNRIAHCFAFIFVCNFYQTKCDKSMGARYGIHYSNMPNYRPAAPATMAAKIRFRKWRCHRQTRLGVVTNDIDGNTVISVYRACCNWLLAKRKTKKNTNRICVFPFDLSRCQCRRSEKWKWITIPLNELRCGQTPDIGQTRKTAVARNNEFLAIYHIVRAYSDHCEFLDSNNCVNLRNGRTRRREEDQTRSIHWKWVKIVQKKIFCESMNNGIFSTAKLGRINRVIGRGW